jgi:hypothetical protein
LEQYLGPIVGGICCILSFLFVVGGGLAYLFMRKKNATGDETPAAAPETAPETTPETAPETAPETESEPEPEPEPEPSDDVLPPLPDPDAIVDAPVAPTPDDPDAPPPPPDSQVPGGPPPLLSDHDDEPEPDPEPAPAEPTKVEPQVTQTVEAMTPPPDLVPDPSAVETSMPTMPMAPLEVNEFEESPTVIIRRDPDDTDES